MVDALQIIRVIISSRWSFYIIYSFIKYLLLCTSGLGEPCEEYTYVLYPKTGGNWFDVAWIWQPEGGQGFGAKQQVDDGAIDWAGEDKDNHKTWGQGITKGNEEF